MSLQFLVQQQISLWKSSERYIFNGDRITTWLASGTLINTATKNIFGTKTVINRRRLIDFPSIICRLPCAESLVNNQSENGWTTGVWSDGCPDTGDESKRETTARWWRVGVSGGPPTRRQRAAGWLRQAFAGNFDGVVAVVDRKRLGRQKTAVFGMGISLNLNLISPPLSTLLFCSSTGTSFNHPLQAIWLYPLTEVKVCFVSQLQVPQGNYKCSY